MRRGATLRGLVALGGALAALLLVVLGVAMTQGVGGEPLGRTDAGFDTVPDFTIDRFDGETFNGEPFVLAEHADGPLFIYFWASWCAPCEEEAPVIEALWPEYEERGYTFVGVNILDTEEDATRFIERHDLTFPLVRDVERSVYLDYGVQGLPEAFFVRPGLTLQQKYNGALAEDEFRSLLDELRDAS